MLFPRSHSWTQLQKRLVVGAGLIVLTLCAAGIYGYERFYRGPDESVFCGTWEDPFLDMNDPSFFEFRKDRIFVQWYLHDGEKWELVRGTWYAGGRNLYLRFPADYFSPDGPQRPSVCHIVDISRDDISVRLFREDEPRHFKRARLVAPPNI